MTRRVGITGLGLVTPLGCGREDFARRLFAGESGVRPVEGFDVSGFPSRLGAEIADFSPGDFVSPRNRRKMDRLSTAAAAATRMALDDAGLALDAVDRDRVGMVLGTAVGATDVAARFGETLFTEGPSAVSPLLVPNTVMNAPAGHAAIELGFRGVNSTVNHRESSAETAVAHAASELARGRADVIFTGGADILSPFFFEILTRFHALSPAGGKGGEAARPFDAARNGYVAGEGAGVLCMETLDHAEARGAVPLCEIAGWGMSAAPAPPTDWPADPKGPVLAMRRALKHAGVSAEDVDCVSASANGSRRLDRLEADALAEVFGEGGDRPLVTSIKGAVGESFSSGGIRAAAMALSMMRGAVPPTLGLETPIREMSFARGAERKTAVAVGMVNGFSSGGTFVSLILRAAG